MSFTAKELDSIIADAYEEQGGEYAQEFFIDAYYGEVGELDTPLGKVTVVDTSGGQGDGAPIAVVVEVQGRHFQMDGYYSSWESSEMDGELYEVKPVQVTRTEYERI